MAHAEVKDGEIHVSIHGKTSTLGLEAAKDLWHSLGAALDQAEDAATTTTPDAPAE